MRVKKIIGWTFGLILAAWLGTLVANISVGPTDWYLEHFQGHWKYTAIIIFFAYLGIIIWSRVLALFLLVLAFLAQCPWETALLTISLTLNEKYFMEKSMSQRREPWVIGQVIRI